MKTYGRQLWGRGFPGDKILALFYRSAGIMKQRKQKKA